MVKVCYKLADEWRSRASTNFEPKKSDISSWLANQSVVFLERIQTFDESLPVEDIELMGKVYGFDKSANVELVSRYFGIGLKAKVESLYQPTADLLGTVGRMKFVRPLFRLLNEVDRDLAIKTFEKNKDFYHPICRGLVEKDLFGDKK
jgi:leukotriene-A4 hydrolase